MITGTNGNFEYLEGYGFGQGDDKAGERYTGVPDDLKYDDFCAISTKDEDPWGCGSAPGKGGPKGSDHQLFGSVFSNAER